MKKKKLEILLQKIPSFEKPSPIFEQYITPANIAADIIFIAHQFNDIRDKKIMDLGCGTGIFSVGTYITGAKKVAGIDIDKQAIKIAKKYAEENNFDIKYMVQDIIDVDIKADTIIMNPPFGAQKTNRKADRAFLERAFETGKIIYTLHLTETIPFIEMMIKSLNGEITFKKNYVFPIKRTYEFHTRKHMKYDVTLIRIVTNK